MCSIFCLLCLADKAIREMNRKEKNIVRGYLNAVKFASQLESRVRIMLVGDTGSGEQSWGGGGGILLNQQSISPFTFVVRHHSTTKV